MDGMVHNNGSYSVETCFVWMLECKKSVIFVLVYIKGKCELPNELWNPNANRYNLCFGIRYHSIPLR